MAAAESRRVHLDANFLVEVAAGGSSSVRKFESWLRAKVMVEVSAIAWSEFLCGPLTKREMEDARAIVPVVEPFTAKDAAIAAAIFNQTGRRSRSHVDCMIAAHAIGRSAAFATLNLQDFRPFARFGLKLL